MTESERMEGMIYEACVVSRQHEEIGTISRQELNRLGTIKAEKLEVDGYVNLLWLLMRCEITYGRAGLIIIIVIGRIDEHRSYRRHMRIIRR